MTDTATTIARLTRARAAVRRERDSYIGITRKQRDLVRCNRRIADLTAELRHLGAR